MKGVTTKILAVMGDIKYAQKTGHNKAQGYNYLTEAAMCEKFQAALIRNGLVVIPAVQTFEVVPAGQTKSGANQFLTTMVINYTIIDPETGESVVSTSLGQGLAFDDKGGYKAATGANKYFMMKLLQVATGDDPEEEESEEPKPKAKSKAPETGAEESAENMKRRDAAIEHCTKIETELGWTLTVKMAQRRGTIGREDFTGVSFDKITEYYRTLAALKEASKESE